MPDLSPARGQLPLDGPNIDDLAAVAFASTEPVDAALIGGGAPLLSPWSMAGLPARRAWVLVGPPLYARRPSLGLMGFMDVPTLSPFVPSTKPVLPLPSPIRL